MFLTCVQSNDKQTQGYETDLNQKQRGIVGADNRSEEVWLWALLSGMVWSKICHKVIISSIRT